MKQYKYYFAILLLSGFIITGCSNSSETNGDTESETEQLIRITQEQVVSEGIELGEPTTRIFEESFTCNGYIMSPANGMAQISTPISGIVETVNCALGDYVNKGEVLCLLSGNDLMVIQQEFAETSAKLKQLKADYERSKILFDEKIGAEKDFLAVESNYKAMTAKYNSLKIRLALLRLDVTKISEGKLYSSFPVVAPIGGYITNMNLLIGQFIEQQQYLIEIIDINQLHLQLSVFEDNISKLRTDQSVQFNSVGEPVLIHSGTLISIGRTINPESRTIQCIAKINNEDGVRFIHRAYINASVIIDKSEARALPNEAIIKSDNDYYVFVIEISENEIYYIRKVKVAIGRVSDGFSEIISGEFPGKVLISGIYNLQSE